MIHLNVVTPDRAFLKTEALSVTLPNKMGEMQALEGHIASLVELKAGIVSYEDKDRKAKRFMVGSGFAEINSHEINVLCEIARYPEEVDKEREIALQRDLEEKLKTMSEQDENEISSIAIELERCVASIKLVE